MLDPAIEGFLNERKEAWLKKKTTSKTTDEEKRAFEEQASSEFSLAEWLPNAAKRAGQLSLVSHPAKFSNPSAKTTALIANACHEADGLLRTGNVEADLDVVGNAAALDVHKFLSLKMENGASVLDCLENDSAAIKEQFATCPIPFEDVCQELLAIKQNKGDEMKTSGLVKQVYFPVQDREYHLLSVMTPSNLMFKMKERIRAMHFSEETKEARDAKKTEKHHENGFAEIFGLSVIGYGGTKPQNISVLNSQNGGAAYLLPSAPPQLADRKVQPPRNDFFRNSLWLNNFKDDFQKFHALLEQDRNNIHIRQERDWLIRSIIYQVADRMWTVRSLEPGWSGSDNYQQLPGHQKIWLDPIHKEQRDDVSNWFAAVQKELALWFIRSYRELLGRSALSLADDELPHIKKMIAQCEEALR